MYRYVGAGGAANRFPFLKFKSSKKFQQTPVKTWNRRKRADLRRLFAFVGQRSRKTQPQNYFKIRDKKKRGEMKLKSRRRKGNWIFESCLLHWKDNDRQTVFGVTFFRRRTNNFLIFQNSLYRKYRSKFIFESFFFFFFWKKLKTALQKWKKGAFLTKILDFLYFPFGGGGLKGNVKVPLFGRKNIRERKWMNNKQTNTPNLIIILFGNKHEFTLT